MEKFAKNKSGAIPPATNDCGDVISTTIYGCEPTLFLSRLHTVASRVERVRLWSLNIIGPYKVMTDNSLKGRIDIYSFF